MTDHGAFEVRVGLRSQRPEPGLAEALEDRFDELQPRLVEHAGAVQLRLVVEARDLWSAVLLAMVATTTSGGEAVDVHAYEVTSPEARPVRTPDEG